jgi:hypothetical protein
LKGSAGPDPDGEEPSGIAVASGPGTNWFVGSKLPSIARITVPWTGTS